MLNRNVTRVLKNAVECTNETNTPSATTVTWNIQTTDAVYLGYQGRFAARYFQLGTVNVVSNTLTVQYWNGTAWTAVDDLVDQTVGFTTSGFISWVNKSDWVKSAQSGVDADIELYWIKITVSANLTAGATMQAVLNLFCDDGLLRAYYPELISDSRYLPPSRSNFLEQYLAAKDLVVLRMKQRRLIDNEAQIIDINSVAIAAVHATAHSVYAPIAMDDTTRALSDSARDKFEKEVQQLVLDVDLNKDGLVSDYEKAVMSQPFIRRR